MKKGARRLNDKHSLMLENSTLPYLPGTSPAKARTGAKTHEYAKSKNIRLPKSEGSSARNDVGEGNAILEGISQTEEQTLMAEKRVRLRKQSLSDVVRSIHHMLDERESDAAFDVLRTNLFNASKSYLNNSRTEIDGISEDSGRVFFELTLRLSASPRWKFELTQQRILPTLCQALSSRTSSFASPFIRTCVLYSLANLTSEEICIDRLLVEGIIKYFFSIVFDALQMAPVDSDDNQQQDTLRLASFCDLAGNLEERCHSLCVVATLATLNVANVTIKWMNQVDRFRFVEQGGFEILLRFAGSPQMHTRNPKEVHNVMSTLCRYSHSDLVRFKQQGNWIHCASPGARRVLHDLIHKAVATIARESAREELGRQAQTLVKHELDPSLLVERLDAVKTVVDIEIEGGYQIVKLPVSPRTTLTPTLTRSQVKYVPWSEHFFPLGLSHDDNKEHLLNASQAYLKKSRLEHTQATAEYEKTQASILQYGVKDNIEDIYAKDLLRSRDSSARVLATAFAHFNLAKALHSAIRGGLNCKNVATTTDIGLLEHAEETAQRSFTLEMQKHKVMKVDLETLLIPVKKRKKSLVKKLEQKTRSLRHARAQLERKHRANRGRRSSSELNNAAAAAAATAAAAAAAAAAATGGGDRGGGGAIAENGGAGPEEYSAIKRSHRRRRRTGNVELKNSASAAAAASTAVAAAAMIPEIVSQRSSNPAAHQRKPRRVRQNKSVVNEIDNNNLSAKLHKLTTDVKTLEERLHTASTTKILDMLNHEETIAYQFLRDGISITGANVESSASALHVASARLATERIVLAMKESLNSPEESVRQWKRFESALQKERKASVQMAVALQTLRNLHEKIEQERKIRFHDEYRKDNTRSDFKEDSSDLASARILLAAMTSDLAVLRFIDSLLKLRLSFLHPRVLQYREEYQNNFLKPSVDLALLNVKAARARVSLCETQNTNTCLSKIEGLKRELSFARWRIANNRLHGKTNIRNAYNPLIEILNDEHATTAHVVHKVGESAANVLVAAKSEIVEAEIAFAEHNKSTLFSEMTEGMLSKNCLACSTVSMYPGVDTDDYLSHHPPGSLLPHPHAELARGYGIFVENAGMSGEEIGNMLDSSLAKNLRSRISQIFNKIQDLVDSTFSLVELLNEQFTKVLGMVRQVYFNKNSTAVPPSMRIALQREETIFHATRKKLHSSNFLVAQYYSMVSATIDAAYAETVLSGNQRLLTDMEIHKAKKSLLHAENSLILANKTLGSQSTNLTEAETKAMRMEMEKLREKKLVAEREKKEQAQELEKQRIKDEEAKRMADFKRAKREEQKENARLRIVKKEAEIKRIKKLKKEKAERERLEYAAKKAKIAKEKAHLKHLQQEWRLEEIQAKKDAREAKIELRKNAEACAKFVLKKVIIFGVLDKLLDESESRARDKRKADVIRGKKMIKESNNWEETEDGGWLNWRTGDKQRLPPECILHMWEVGRMWPSDYWVQQGYGNGPGGWAQESAVTEWQQNDNQETADSYSEEERRYAPDGGYYTANEFYEYYGGWDEWYAAEEAYPADY